MKRSELEHLIRAAGSIANDAEIVVIGSQAILGQFPNAPSPLVVSVEADLFPLHHPERADLIDGSIGEGSSFHELARQGMTDSKTLFARLKETEILAELRKIIEARIRRDATEGGRKQ